MSKKKPQVLEVVDRLGVFTQGDVKDKYEAHEMFLDWFHESQIGKQARSYFLDYWSVSEEMLSPEHIEEKEMMTCNGCGQYTIDDSECFECDDKSLDGRTKQKTFIINW